tara:strand:- start:6081 stop:6263 length:183 start_codon:yes stop_codon:yes gene_type:complete
MATLIQDLKVGDVIPEVGVVHSLDWIDDNRVRVALMRNRRIAAETWDGDFPVPEMVECLR